MFKIGFMELIITIFVVGSVCALLNQDTILEWTPIQDIKDSKPLCEGFDVLDGGKYNCCMDCNNLGYTYLRYEFHGSLFGANVRNCYCNHNGSVQIW